MKIKIQDVLDVDSLIDVVDMLAARVNENESLQDRVNRLQEENKQFNEQMNEERDKNETAHKQYILKLEEELKEKENRLLETIKCLETQLLAAKEEVLDLTSKLEQLQNDNQSTFTTELQQEVEILKSELKMKNEEINQLTASNNTLTLALEKLKNIDIQLQVGMQKHKQRY